MVQGFPHVKEATSWDVSWKLCSSDKVRLASPSPKVILVKPRFILLKINPTCVFISLHDSMEQTTTNERLSLYRRRHKPNTDLNPDAASLVLPRPRPLSEISTGSDQDTAFSPPLTPPLVGAKPPVSILKSPATPVGL